MVIKADRECSENPYLSKGQKQFPRTEETEGKWNGYQKLRLEDGAMHS